MEQYIASTCASEDVSGYELGCKFTEGLKIRHDQNKNTNTYKDEEEEDEDDFDDDDDLTAEILAQNGYAKTEPAKHSNVGNQESVEEDEEEEEDLTAAILAQSGYAKNESPKHSPMTWPSDKKLVSAFKGSREKEGLLETKVRVTWAPDVYDPPPTSEDHLAQNRTERHRSESKKPKNKQKWGGKSAGEGKEKSKGKDKKQVQKYGGSSNKCFKTLEDNEKLVGSPSTATDHLAKTKTERPSKSNTKSVGKGKGKDKKQVQKCKTVDDDDGLADSLAPYAEFEDRY